MAVIEAHHYPESDLLQFTAFGEIAAGDLVEALEVHLGTTPSDNVIWDLCRADLSAIDSDALTRVSDCARKLSVHRANPRTLFVVEQKQERFLLKLYSEISALRGSPVRYEYFHSLKKAYAALGLEGPLQENGSA